MEETSLPPEKPSSTEHQASLISSPPTELRSSEKSTGDLPRLVVCAAYAVISNVTMNKYSAVVPGYVIALAWLVLGALAFWWGWKLEATKDWWKTQFLPHRYTYTITIIILCTCILYGSGSYYLRTSRITSKQPVDVHSKDAPRSTTASANSPTAVPPNPGPIESDTLAKLNALLKRYTENHPHDSGTATRHIDPASLPRPTSASPTGQQPANNVYEDLSRQSQWAHSLNLDCQDTALYRSQQFVEPYKHGAMMGQPIPHTLDDALVQSLQNDELEMVRRYDGGKTFLMSAHDNAIARMKNANTGKAQFTPNDEIKDSQSLREANYEAEKLTPIVDLKNNNSSTCTRFGKIDDYLSTLLNRLGNY